MSYFHLFWILFTFINFPGEFHLLWCNLLWYIRSPPSCVALKYFTMWSCQYLKFFIITLLKTTMILYVYFTGKILIYWSKKERPSFTHLCFKLLGMQNWDKTNSPVTEPKSLTVLIPKPNIGHDHQSVPSTLLPHNLFLQDPA